MRTAGSFATNLYLDSSALVKRYLVELDTPETRRIIAEADVQGTTVVSRAEVAAAFAKAVRMEIVTREEARSMLGSFRYHWPNIFSLQVSSTVVDRAERLAFEENLRGYDTVQLASALVWRTGLGEDVTFATFDLRLWEAVGRHVLHPFPENLPHLLDRWKQT